MVQGLASTKAAVVKIAKTLTSTIIPLDPEVQVIGERLPVTSTADLKQLDSDIKDDKNLYGKLVSYLSQSGGEDANTTTRKVFRTLLSDEVQMKISWEGMKKKERFDQRETLIKAIYETVRNHFPNATDAGMKNVMKTDMRNAKQRFDNMEKKEGAGSREPP